MAAATTAIVAVAGLGLTAYSMYDADKKSKEASAAADQAKKDLLNVQEQNMYKGVQVADLNELERQERARMNATATLGLQESGAEAVLGGIPKLTEVDREAALKTALEQAKREEQRDLLIAQEDAAIEARKKGVERNVYAGELQGAQMAAAEADIAKAQATGDLITGVGNLAGGIGEATSLEAGAKRQAGKQPQPTVDEAFLGSESTANDFNVAGLGGGTDTEYDLYSNPYKQKRSYLNLEY